jgi:hypothetical protein
VFGSEFIPGPFAPPPIHERLPPELVLAASELLAFDVFIHNSDRRAENPNLFVYRGELLAFDHGDAFAFVLPLLGGTDPTLDPLLEAVVAGHAFGQSLRGRLAPLDRFRAALAELMQDGFEALMSAAPSAWCCGLAAGKYVSSKFLPRAR